MRKDESEKGIVLRPADRARDRTVAGRAAVSTGCGRAGTGVKLGLANVVTLFALTRLSVRDAFFILVCRVTISSVLMGSVTAFLFSLLGGLLSLVAMYLLLRLEGRFCSLLGISVAGAAAHNIGQVLAAIFWMQTAAVAAYLPFLLVMSVPLGLVTGLTCSVVLAHMKKIEFHV